MFGGIEREIIKCNKCKELTEDYRISFGIHKVELSRNKKWSTEDILGRYLGKPWARKIGGEACESCQNNQYYFTADIVLPP